MAPAAMPEPKQWRADNDEDDTGRQNAGDQSDIHKAPHQSKSTEARTLYKSRQITVGASRKRLTNGRIL
jgi:hypothetical protein